ncbi:MAG: metallophosphoesterase, partial [Kineosporiaceae bacterium]|nr:metallophosphoesterase [Aeromicrobium sp.]
MNNTGPVAIQSGRVAIAGDWHGSISWAQSVIPRIHREAPDVDTIFHVGDFGLYPEAHSKGFLAAIDFWCKAANIRRVYVCPGNHEHWGELTKRFDAQPGQAVQLSSVVWVLPRGYRFTVSGKEWMSFGGAASLDREFRTPGVTWWPGGVATNADVDHAIA